MISYLNPPMEPVLQFRAALITPANGRPNLSGFYLWLHSPLRTSHFPTQKNYCLDWLRHIKCSSHYLLPDRMVECLEPPSPILGDQAIQISSWSETNAFKIDTCRFLAMHLASLLA